MKNKGFTLAELLGVIAILGIIALITVPAINRSLNQGKDDLYKTQIEQLKKGAQDYYAEHLSEMPKTVNSTACKTIDELQKEGYLPLDIKNPKTDKAFSQTMKICVKKITDMEYDYEVQDNGQKGEYDEK